MTVITSPRSTRLRCWPSSTRSTACTDTIVSLGRLWTAITGRSSAYAERWTDIGMPPSPSSLRRIGAEGAMAVSEPVWLYRTPLAVHHVIENDRGKSALACNPRAELDEDDTVYAGPDWAVTCREC